MMKVPLLLLLGALWLLPGNRLMSQPRTATEPIQAAMSRLVTIGRSENESSELRRLTALVVQSAIRLDQITDQSKNDEFRARFTEQLIRARVQWELGTGLVNVRVALADNLWQANPDQSPFEALMGAIADREGRGETSAPTTRELVSAAINSWGRSDSNATLKSSTGRLLTEATAVLRTHGQDNLGIERHCQGSQGTTALSVWHRRFLTMAGPTIQSWT